MTLLITNPDALDGLSPKDIAERLKQKRLGKGQPSVNDAVIKDSKYNIARRAQMRQQKKKVKVNQKEQEVFESDSGKAYRLVRFGKIQASMPRDPYETRANARCDCGTVMPGLKVDALKAGKLTACIHCKLLELSNGKQNPKPQPKPRAKRAKPSFMEMSDNDFEKIGTKRRR